MSDFNPRDFIVLTGTWVRTNTHPEDLTDFRKLTYRLNRSRALLGDPRRIHIHAKNGEVVGSREPQLREGTFTIVVRPFVDGYAPFRTKVARAKQQTRWFVQDRTCRSPMLTFTSARTLRQGEFV